MFSFLQSQRVNLQVLQENACKELVLSLEKIDGQKTILLDETLYGPLGLVISTSLFSDRGIMLRKLNADNILQDVANVVFLVRPQVLQMKTIVKLVQNHTEKNLVFHIFFVPHRSSLCERQLENGGVLCHFGHIVELSWNFFPIDFDIISMELPFVFRDVFVDGDTTTLHQAAKGLVQIQQLYGRIPKIYGKGNNAQRLWEFAKQLGAKKKSLFCADKGAIDQLIILDRSIDLFSILATQLTYEGLIDEFFEIRQNQISICSEFITSRSEETLSAALSNSDLRQETFFLNSGDMLYAELRNMNFNAVGKTLSQKARDICAQMNATTENNSVQDMKILVDKLPTLLARKQSLAVHTSLAENIRKLVDDFQFTDDLAIEQDFMMCEDSDKVSTYIDNLIAKKSDLRNILRLMCIQCYTASGFKEKVLNYYKKELLHVYGIQILLTLSNLEKGGLFFLQSESRAYAVLRKTLNLTVDDVAEVDPKDISYVHSCYAPLTGRIIEQTIKPLGWQSLKSKINNFPGQTFEDFQAQLIGIGGRQSAASNETSSLNTPRIILVLFVGGCTFAEIAALRFLSRQEDNNVEFVIATTKIMNKNTFLDSLM